MVVRSKWQEITNSDWIIGVEVENVGPRSDNELKLVLMIIHVENI